MNTRILIPAAGFGKRVGSPPAKELLPHPKTGKPMITEAVELAKSFGEPLVLTRADKKELIEYMTKNKIEFEIIDETREWPDTILAAKEYWLDANIVLLPDTEFLPTSLPKKLVEGLEIDNTSVTFGTFKVNDFSNWGMIDPAAKTLCIADKPSINKNNSIAWGLIAFRIEVGEPLFQAISDSNKDRLWKETGINYKTYELEYFNDFTRS